MDLHPLVVDVLTIEPQLQHCAEHREAATSGTVSASCEPPAAMAAAARRSAAS